MENTIYHIYDKIFKKILTLSAMSVINLINGLFGTNYPATSSIRYNWTEFMDDRLKRILADTIITINDVHSYHLEAQMTNDDNIIFRVFEYGFSHANRNSIRSGDYYELLFPEPRIIYLCPDENLPDKYTLRLNFGSQGHFDYKVDTLQFNAISTEELNQRKMIILIPFKLLRLRKDLEKARTAENLKALKKLIQNDIIGSIEENLRLNNITTDDARKLKRLTHKLYEQIYSHYEEMEELNDMTDESLMLDIDYIEKEHEQALAAQQKAHEQELAANQKAHEQELAANQKAHEQELAANQKAHEQALAAKDNEIAHLKALLAQNSKTPGI